MNAEQQESMSKSGEEKRELQRKVALLLLIESSLAVSSSAFSPHSCCHCRVNFDGNFVVEEIWNALTHGFGM